MKKLILSIIFLTGIPHAFGMTTGNGTFEEGLAPYARAFFDAPTDDDRNNHLIQLLTPISQTNHYFFTELFKKHGSVFQSTTPQDFGEAQEMFIAAHLLTILEKEKDKRCTDGSLTFDSMRYILTHPGLMKHINFFDDVGTVLENDELADDDNENAPFIAQTKKMVELLQLCNDNIYRDWKLPDNAVRALTDSDYYYLDNFAPYRLLWTWAQHGKLEEVLKILLFSEHTSDSRLKIDFDAIQHALELIEKSLYTEQNVESRNQLLALRNYSKHLKFSAGRRRPMPGDDSDDEGESSSTTLPAKRRHRP